MSSMLTAVAVVTVDGREHRLEIPLWHFIMDTVHARMHSFGIPAVTLQRVELLSFGREVGRID